MKKRTAKELREYRNEYDSRTVISSTIPEDWEVDLFTDDERTQFEDRRKTNRKNEVNRQNSPDCRNGRKAVGGPHSDNPVSPALSATLSGEPFPPADNMGVSKRLEGKYRQVFGGFDGGMEFGLDGEWRSDRRYRHIMKILSDAKEAAEDQPEGKQVIELGGRQISVWAKGSSGGIMYKFIFECAGMKIYVHSKPKGNIQPVRVRFGFEALAKYNCFELFDDLSQWMREIGLKIESDKLTRVDMQIMTNRPVSDYVGPILNNQAVMKARGSAEIFLEKNGDISSYTIGKTAVQMCIYDKRKQLLEKADAIDYATFRREILDDGPLPEVLTRIEFRVKRDLLARYGIDSMEDLRSSVLALLEILTTDWFRILNGPKSKGNEHKQQLAACWKELQDQFLYYFDEDNQVNKRTSTELKEHVQRKEHSKAENLVKQMVGCAASYAALTRSFFRNGIEEILDFIREIAEPLVPKFAEKYELRRKLNLVERGFRPDACVQDDLTNGDYRDFVDDKVYERVHADIRKQHVLASEVPF